MTRTCQRGDCGFTLIELLVVIVILGILAGVVVFAVRGIGSKGGNEALGADRRTLRTAQEAFCARFGEYGTERQLAGLDPAPDGKKYKFISEESELNDIELLTGPGDPKPCGDTGYRIQPTERGGSTPDDPADPPGPGSFALTLPPPFSRLGEDNRRPQRFSGRRPGVAAVPSPSSRANGGPA